MASLHVYEMFERCILQIQSLISRARRDSRDVCGKACARTFIYPRRVSVLCDFFEKKKRLRKEGTYVLSSIDFSMIMV